jgi:hypothetical protein
MTPSAASTGSARLTAWIYALADFNRSIALAEPRYPKALSRMPGLNAHL